MAYRALRKLQSYLLGRIWEYLSHERTLQALRATRDVAKTKAALAALERRARTTENLLPAILAAVEAYATVGEICAALRDVYGTYTETNIA